MRALQQRSAALRALFDEVSVVRMQGVPILNPALRVATVGFELATPHAANTQHAGAAAHAPLCAVGILITPWFMNLVCFSLARLDQPAQVGSHRAQAVGTQSFDFIAAHEERFGSYAACSLFSPMFEFKDQATAVATAEAVLAELRRPAINTVAEASAPTSTPQAAALAASSAARAPDRRGFLLGRRSPSPGAAP
jgi:[NiFe] hydrogenase assembly HybE family chaperone